MTADRLVILYAPSALEEAVVDALLTLESTNGFCSFPVNFHHHANKKLTLAEQVSGRKRRICFHIYIDATGATLLQGKLEKDFTGAGIQFRVLDILDSVEI